MNESFYQQARRRIWSALLSASSQEIADGLSFYAGAHGLCRLIAAAHPPQSPSSVAGIYAALSPLNTWDTNVANILDLLRDWSAAPVNTTDTNFHKALNIAAGSDPLSVLSGRKVRAFYRAIADPDDHSSIPVDRHLINLAVGLHNPTKREQADLAHDHDLYSRVERVYHDLGKREGIGNRLASIAWFVQRRISRTGQQPLPHPDSPLCCSGLMHSHGVYKGWRRFRCSICGVVRSARPSDTILLSASARESYAKRQQAIREIQLDSPITYPLSILHSAPIVYLPSSHPHRNSAGWQYLARHVTMETTGELLRPDEHVHHIDGNKLNCRRANLKVMLAETHGRHHARYQLLYMVRDKETGRWAAGSDVLSFSEQWQQEVAGIESGGVDEMPF